MRNLTFEESVLRHYVVRTPKKGIVYDQYWNYCKDNNIPFVAITQNGKRTWIVLDMFPTKQGLSQKTLDQISSLLKDVHQKKNGLMIINPERLTATIKLNRAEDVAKTVYELALSDRERT